MTEQVFNLHPVRSNDRPFSGCAVVYKDSTTSDNGCAGSRLVDGHSGGVKLRGMVMVLPEGKKLISTAEAAKALGVSMGRVRQLALLGPKKGGLTRYHAAPTALVFDAEEVAKLAKAKRTTGRPKGGFKAN